MTPFYYRRVLVSPIKAENKSSACHLVVVDMPVVMVEEAVIVAAALATEAHIEVATIEARTKAEAAVAAVAILLIAMNLVTTVVVGIDTTLAVTESMNHTRKHTDPKVLLVTLIVIMVDRGHLNANG